MNDERLHASNNGDHADPVPAEDDVAENPPVETAPTDPSPRYAIELAHASRWYGEVIGINDISARLEPGITGLLGPNGAGKSTLIKLLVGLIRPSTGRVRLLGEDPWNNPDLMRRLGYVPEGPAPWRDLTGLAATVRAAKLAGLDETEAEAAATQAIERVGLSDAAVRRIEGYSFGMQQRLKLVLAIVHDPEILILDEPLLGTDPLGRRDLLDLIRALGNEGKSVLVSTHVLPDVEALTDRILVLDHGRLMAHGSVTEIRDLLERYPRTVRIETPKPRELGAAVWGWSSVLRLEALDDALVVHTKEPAAFYESLQALLVTGEHAFTAVTSADDNVEAVFRYLVG